jgi:hypothetical protein
MDDEPEMEKLLNSSKPTDIIMENQKVKEEEKNEGLYHERSHDTQQH